MLLPKQNNEVRKSLDDWFEVNEITPKIIAEFEDSALLKAFGEAGIGVFPAPNAIADRIEHMYHAKKIGTIENIKETYYAISPERKLKHPGVIKITEEARNSLTYK